MVDKDECWTYTNPEELDYSQVDEGVRELCKEINKSKWLRTGESCAGHPRSPFAWSERTYLRLILYKPKMLSYHMFWEIIEKFNDSWKTMRGFLEVFFDQRYSYGISFYVYFPKIDKLHERDIMIDSFLRSFQEVEELYRISLEKWNGEIDEG